MKKFTFWDTPEGTLGMVVAVAGGIAGVWGFAHILPFLISLLANTLTAAAELGAIVFLFWAFFLDKKLPKFLGMRYQLLMKAITYTAIKKDPALFLRWTQDVAKERMKKIYKSLEGARAAANLLESSRESFSNQAKKIQVEYERMKKMPNVSPIELNTREIKIADLKRAYDDLEVPSKNSQRWLFGLDKARQYQEAQLDQIAFKIDLTLQKAEIINKLASSVALFKDFITGNDDNSRLQEEGLAMLDHDYMEKSADIDAFLQDSQKLFDAQDTQRAIMSAEGQEILANLSQSKIFQLPDERAKQQSATVASPSYMNYINKG
jgi:hypothetical protein